MGTYEEAREVIERKLNSEGIIFTRKNDTYTMDPSDKAIRLAFSMEQNGINIGRGQYLRVHIEFTYNKKVEMIIVPYEYDNLNFSLPSPEEISVHMRRNFEFIKVEGQYMIVDRRYDDSSRRIDNLMDTLVKMTGSRHVINDIPCFLKANVDFEKDLIRINMWAYHDNN